VGLFRKLARLGAFLSLIIVGGDTEAGLGPVPATVPVKLINHKEAPAAMDESVLRFVSAREIVSLDGAFGGISALGVANGQFDAVSDDGTRYGFRLAADGGLSNVTAKPMPTACGPRRIKKDQDSESLVESGPGGFSFVGFEWYNRICRFGAGGGSSDRVTWPRAMQRWPRTGGAEAMAYLPDGRFLVFAERPEDERRISPILLFPGDPTEPGATPVELRFNPPAGYHVSDATALPDGRLLVLVRRFRLPFKFDAKLLMVERPDYTPGALMEGRAIVTLAPPGIADNFEAVALDRADGGTRLWLASDDNFLWPQKNWLLEFELLPKN
jgi:hypothetical protein